MFYVLGFHQKALLLNITLLPSICIFCLQKLHKDEGCSGDQGFSEYLFQTLVLLFLDPSFLIYQES